MDEYSKIVSNSYDELSDAYHEWARSVRVAERQKYLQRFLRSLPAGSKVLDIGCGNGLLSSKPLTGRFRVTGIDVSGLQINEARSQFPQAQFIHADIRDHDFGAERFDGICSFYCFNHLPRDSYLEVLGKLYHWLEDDGLLIASFGTGDTERWIGEWLGTRQFFSSFTPAETLALFSQTSFELTDHSVETALEDGVETDFLWVTAKKRANQGA